MAATLNISVDQGSNLTVNFPLTNADGSTFDLTGYSARAQVRQTFGASTALVDASTTNAKLSIASGTVTWQLVPADTANEHFPAADDASIDLVYDLKVTSPGGQVYTAASGTFSVNRAVTR